MSDDASPEDMYKRLDREVDSRTLTMDYRSYLQHLRDKGIAMAVDGPPALRAQLTPQAIDAGASRWNFSVDAQITSSAIIASERSAAHPDKVTDCIILTHDVLFSPHFDASAPPTGRVMRYGIFVRPFTPGLAPLDYFDDPSLVAHIESAINPCLDQFRVPSPPGAPIVGQMTQDVSGAELAKVQPDATTGSTNFSVSIDTEWSGSVGVFGTDGTATFSESVSVAHSTSRSVPDVRVFNLSTLIWPDATARWEFHLAANDLWTDNILEIQREDFQCTVSSYFRIPDTLQTTFRRGVHPEDEATAARFQFEIILAAVAWSLAPEGVPGGALVRRVFDRHVIEVRQPPLPAPLGSHRTDDQA